MQKVCVTCLCDIDTITTLTVRHIHSKDIQLRLSDSFLLLLFEVSPLQPDRLTAAAAQKQPAAHRHAATTRAVCTESEGVLDSFAQRLSAILCLYCGSDNHSDQNQNPGDDFFNLAPNGAQSRRTRVLPHTHTHNIVHCVSTQQSPCSRPLRSI